MDLLVATMAPRYADSRTENPSPLAAIVMFLITNAVSIFATWLSWNCSTQQGLEFLPKLLWAALAYCFGFLYILFYAFKHRNACSPPMPMPMPY